MKKAIAVLLCIVMIACCFAGCGAKNYNNDGIKIVTTVFPAFDFARQLCGDKAEVIMLLKPGAESHSFEPTPADIINITSCDLFIYAGGEGEAWAKSLLNTNKSETRKEIAMLDCVEPITEHFEGDGHNHTDEDHLEPEYDEHVWTSPKNAQAIVTKISEALCSIDAANSEYYTTTTQNYIAELTALDNTFKTVVQNAKIKAVVFADRFPVRYFTEQYGLDVISAFPGCAAQTEPSPSVLLSLVETVKIMQIKAVFYTELSTKKTADMVSEQTGALGLLFHSCHNVTRDEFESGATYISLMKQNAENLKTALS